MFSTQGFNYERGREYRNDGSFYDFAEVVVQGVDRVHFHKGISECRKRKLMDVAHLRFLKAKSRGVQRPVIVVWDGYKHTESYQDLHRCKETSELISISKSSIITTNLRSLFNSKNYLFVGNKLQVKAVRTNKDRFTQELIDELYAEDRIAIYRAEPNISLREMYADFDPYKDLVAVGQMGFPSLYARDNGYPIVFNTSFFLYEEEDYSSHFSLFGDAYNLQIEAGIIQSPALYKRSTLLIDSDHKVSMKKVAAQDLTLEFLGSTWDLSQFPVYTRSTTIKTQGKTLTHSPLESDQIHFIIIDRAVVGYKLGGGVQIPQNGFILSLPKYKAIKKSWQTKVNYTFTSGKVYQSALQCGPGLINDGKIILSQDSLSNEEFFPKKINSEKMLDFGVVPTDYALDIDKTKAARTLMGVDKDYNFRVMVVEAVNRGMEEPWGESSGITLLELAKLAKRRKWKYALNLDGGGSATINYLYGQLTKGADRKRLPGLLYERMVPNVGVIRWE